MTGSDAVYTQEGNRKEIEWKNTDVEFPILSTKRMAKGGNLVGYGESGGVVLGADDTKDAFVSHGDVYFMKLLIPKKFQRPKQGFAGHGVAA